MERLGKTIAGNLQKADLKRCVIFVDDKTSDSSLSLIKDCCKRNENMFYISFEKNMGLSAALKAGFDATQSKYVGYIDAALQTDPMEFNLLIPFVEAYQLVTGIRATRKVTRVKKISSTLSTGFLRIHTGDDPNSKAS